MYDLLVVETLHTWRKQRQQLAKNTRIEKNRRDNYNLSSGYAGRM